MSEIDELYSVQLCDNTPKEAQFARAEIEAIIKPIIAERDALREALRMVEHVRMLEPDGVYTLCPWCSGPEKLLPDSAYTGHNPGCPRQAALKEAAE